MNTEKTYLDTLQESIDDQISLKHWLTQKEQILQKLTEDFQSSSLADLYKSKLEFFNQKIDHIKTKSELATLEKVIAEKQAYFAKYAKDFEVKKIEVEMQYNKVLAMCNQRAKANPQLDAFLKSVDYKLIDSNIEYKVNFYFKLVDFIKGK